MSFAETVVPKNIYRVCFGVSPLSLPPKEAVTQAPGRYDPPDFSFRLLYTSNSLVVAYIEVLADLRPNTKAATLLGRVTVSDEHDDSVILLQEAVRARLATRSAAAIIAPPKLHVVDITAATSRTIIERELKISRTKIGDFVGSETTLARRASVLVRNARKLGIASPSAEASSIDENAMNYMFFESNEEPGTLMVSLVCHTSVPALEERIYLNQALETLGIDAHF